MQGLRGRGALRRWVCTGWGIHERVERDEEILPVWVGGLKRL